MMGGVSARPPHSSAGLDDGSQTPPPALWREGDRQLQHEEPSALSADKMTLQELQDIALEAGIDPAFLRRAAQEIDTGAIEMST